MPESTQRADPVRMIQKKTWWATLQFWPYLTRASDHVHWGRVSPDYERRPVFHALCGWSKGFNKFEMSRTEDSISCKRCQQSAKLLIDGSGDFLASRRSSFVSASRSATSAHDIGGQSSQFRMALAPFEDLGNGRVGEPGSDGDGAQ